MVRPERQPAFGGSLRSLTPVKSEASFKNRSIRFHPTQPQGPVTYWTILAGMASLASALTATHLVATLRFGLQICCGHRIRDNNSDGLQ